MFGRLPIRSLCARNSVPKDNVFVDDPKNEETESGQREIMEEVIPYSLVKTEYIV